MTHNPKAVTRLARILVTGSAGHLGEAPIAPSPGMWPRG
jgi:hypothetical protein